MDRNQRPASIGIAVPHHRNPQPLRRRPDCRRPPECSANRGSHRRFNLIEATPVNRFPTDKRDFVVIWRSPRSTPASAIRAAAEWLDRRRQLGRDVFTPGEAEAAAVQRGRTTDPTDLFRACLVALRVADLVNAGPRRFVTLWQVPDAMARITRMLAERPEGGALGFFLLRTEATGPHRELRCRAASASTLLGFELARAGTVALEQAVASRELTVHARASEATGERLASG